MDTQAQTGTQRPLALVTGASSGIGAVFAERLAHAGYDVIAVARRRERLDALAARLRTETGAQVEALPADLADREGVRTVAERITSGGTLALLVNNAGFGVYKPLAQMDPAVLAEMITVNVLALTLLTRAALPGMLTAGSGAIINVSSGLAFMPHATQATYSGTKAFVVNFSRALAEEVGPRGVRVQALCPGVTRTDFHLRSGTDLSRLPPGIQMSAEDVVDASLAALELDDLICIPALDDPAALDAYDRAQAEVSAHFRRDSRPADRYRRGE